MLQKVCCAAHNAKENPKGITKSIALQNATVYRCERKLDRCCCFFLHFIRFTNGRSHFFPAEYFANKSRNFAQLYQFRSAD